MAVGPYWVGDKPNEALALSVVRSGQPVDLSIYSDATAVLTGPGDTAIDTTGTTLTLASDKVIVAWPLDRSLFLVPGPYTLQVRLTSETGASDQAFPVEFWVNSPEPYVDQAWADRRDVLTYTGVQVEGPLLMQAQGVIELFTGTSYAATLPANGFTLRARDRRHLKMAVAYQAAFMASQESVFARPGMQSVSQEGLSLNTGGNPEAWTLAPLAASALAQVTWRNGDRTTKVGRARRRVVDDEGDAGATPWIPTQQFIAGRRW